MNTLDVSDEDAQIAAIRRGVERFGGVDILVAGAGVFPSTELISELSIESWQKAMDINVMELRVDRWKLLKLVVV